MRTLPSLLLFFVISWGTTPLAARTQSGPDNTIQIPKPTAGDYDLREPPPGAAAGDPRELLQAYTTAMANIAQRFSSTLAAVSQGVDAGKLTSEEARDISVTEYEQAEMQFQLLASLRALIQQELDRNAPDAPDPNDSAPPQNAAALTATLPLSSLQLSPSLARYLGLTRSQIAAIQEITTQERRHLQPVTEQLQSTKTKLLAPNLKAPNGEEVKSLAAMQARLLNNAILANVRMESKIYKILTPEQQIKLNDFKESIHSSQTNERNSYSFAKPKEQ